MQSSDVPLVFGESLSWMTAEACRALRHRLMVVCEQAGHCHANLFWAEMACRADPDIPCHMVGLVIGPEQLYSSLKIISWPWMQQLDKSKFNARSNLPGCFQSFQKRLVAFLIGWRLSCHGDGSGRGRPQDGVESLRYNTLDVCWEAFVLLNGQTYWIQDICWNSTAALFSLKTSNSTFFKEEGSKGGLCFRHGGPR